MVQASSVRGGFPLLFHIHNGRQVLLKTSKSASVGAAKVTTESSKYGALVENYLEKNCGWIILM